MTRSVTTTPNVAMTGGEWAMLVTLSLLWGGGFFFIGVAIRALPPFSIVFSRLVIAALVLLAVVTIAGPGLPRSGRVWRAFFAMGAINNLIPFSLLAFGQTALASGLVSILNATTPLFGVVVAHLLTDDERMTPGRFLGVLTGFLGVAIMIGRGAFSGLGDTLVAELACLGAALSYALASVYGRRFRRLGVTPMQTATGQITAAAILMAPLVMVVDRPWEIANPGTAVWLSIATLAIASTAFAYILYFRLLATAGAVNLLLVTLLVPVSAILLGALFLDERLAPTHLAGMALIALGLAAIDGRPARRLRRAFAGNGKTNGQ